ncbi:MAG: hypothetical protein ABSE52_07550 [Candidatus Dormibacteria bacterium]|jgi:hypothetical protein
MLPTPLTDTARGRTATRIAPRPWRPRPSLLVVGLVLVLASVVGVGALIHSVSGEHGILVMSQTVQAGQVISAGDLEVVNVSQDMGGLTVIDSAYQSSVDEISRTAKHLDFGLAQAAGIAQILYRPECVLCPPH